MINLELKNNKLRVNTNNSLSNSLNKELNHSSGDEISRSFQTGKLSIINIENDLNLSQQYAEICLQYNVENKWILMINPDEQPLEHLSQNHEINTAKILKVHANKVNVVLANIESALCKGNCAAVVLCNPLLNNEEIAQLSKYAELGKTACIVIKNNRQLH